MKFFLILFLILPLHLLAQEVIFCESVDKTGSPKNASTDFTISAKGGFFKVLVKLPKPAESKSVIFDVYSVKKGKETFDNSLRMDIQPWLTWFYKEITLYKEGEYHVYVYDEKDKLLGIGNVNIRMR